MHHFIRSLFFIFLPLFAAHGLQAQQLAATVTVNTQRLDMAERSLIDKMQRAFTEFLNGTDFTGEKLDADKRITCTFYITIMNVSPSRDFDATLQIVSSRPVYGTSYTTPLFNYKDSDFTFRFNETEILTYNPNAYTSNIVSLLSYYAYFVIALDQYTFSPQGGQGMLSEARRVASLAQAATGSSWSADWTKENNRVWLAENLDSPNYEGVRQALYLYHMQGLDKLSDQPEQGQQAITEGLLLIEPASRRNTNNLFIRALFNAKADEIYNVLSHASGAPVNNELITSLKISSPGHISLWDKLK